MMDAEMEEDNSNSLTLLSTILSETAVSLGEVLQAAKNHVRHGKFNLHDFLLKY